MFKVIIWGIGQEYRKYINLIKFYESTEEIHVQAITSNENNISRLDGYVFCKKDWLHKVEFDYCIVAVKNFMSVKMEAEKIGIDSKKLIPVKVFQIPYFSFEQYIKLKDSNLSIISRNCWGGICYNTLGMEFNSPFINMFFNDKDFNKLLQNLEYYLSLNVEYECHETNLNHTYPVGRLGDILLYFNHYTDFKTAKESWERRLKRINYNNLLIISSTLSEETASEFDKLPYANKYIFVPFKNELTSNIYFPYTSNNDGITIGMVSNKTAYGYGINLLKLLNHRKEFNNIQYV